MRKKDEEYTLSNDQKAEIFERWVKALTPQIDFQLNLSKFDDDTKQDVRMRVYHYLRHCKLSSVEGFANAIVSSYVKAGDVSSITKFDFDKRKMGNPYQIVDEFLKKYFDPNFDLSSYKNEKFAHIIELLAENLVKDYQSIYGNFAYMNLEKRNGKVGQIRDAIVKAFSDKGYDCFHNFGDPKMIFYTKAKIAPKISEHNQDMLLETYAHLAYEYFYNFRAHCGSKDSLKHYTPKDEAEFKEYCNRMDSVMKSIEARLTEKSKNDARFVLSQENIESLNEESKQSFIKNKLHTRHSYYASLSQAIKNINACERNGKELSHEDVKVIDEFCERLSLVDQNFDKYPLIYFKMFPINPSTFVHKVLSDLTKLPDDVVTVEYKKHMISSKNIHNLRSRLQKKYASCGFDYAVRGGDGVKAAQIINSPQFRKYADGPVVDLNNKEAREQFCENVDNTIERLGLAAYAECVRAVVDEMIKGKKEKDLLPSSALVVSGEHGLRAYHSTQGSFVQETQKKRNVREKI